MKRKIVIVDIDGTIADCSHRVHFLEGENKDWDSFYEACDRDKPIDSIIYLAMVLSFQYEIVFCTGCRESTREKTIDWLKRHLWITADLNRLLMRNDGDFRHDTVVKPRLILKAGIELKDIAYVLEDRDSMVKKWREMGVTCLQVANGDF